MTFLHQIEIIDFINCRPVITYHLPFPIIIHIKYDCDSVTSYSVPLFMFKLLYFVSIKVVCTSSLSRSIFPPYLGLYGVFALHFLQSDSFGARVLVVVGPQQGSDCVVWMHPSLLLISNITLYTKRSKLPLATFIF